MSQRLKSLELQGYKTFASRTEFAFAGQVTAIVGPNGSGKSNIVDAIRWVLGEQSFSLLRGKKTEDMIFAGSQQRPRASMAAATLVFDNSDHWLPIDFTEVAVTRRAYRDGQNEYLINGQKVRLKDVYELLAQSGLAEQTYTIIGQGLVDAALALRAEDRRRLFEEAAGIGLYRSRRAEALRRLENTSRNLERVQDILAELRPRLRSLERQAARAQEYAQIQADLKLVLREWYGYHWHRQQRVLREAQVLNRQEAENLEKARRAWGQLGQEVREQRQALQAVRAQLDAWHHQLGELHTRLQKIGRDIAVTGEQERSIEVQARQASAEALRLDEEMQLQQERLQRAEADAHSQDETLREAQAAMQQARQALAQQMQAREQAEAALRTAHKEQSRLQTRREQLLAQQQARERQREQQRDAAERFEQTLADANEALHQARLRQSQIAGVARQAQERLAQAESDVQAYRAQEKTLEQALQQAHARRNAIQSDIARLQARLDVLDQAEQALSGYAEGARRVLQAGAKGRIRNVAGALSARLQVPAEFETAIAAALGEMLDAVLLDDDQVDAALDVLLESPNRGVLVPHQGVRPVPSITVPPAAEACLGVASILVEAPATLQPVVDLLLGRVVVMQDRAAARRILTDLPPDVRVVTLKGEVFTADGVVYAGKAGGGGALGRSRERRTLQQSLAQAQADLKRWDDEIQAQQVVLAGLRERRDARQQAVAQLRIEGQTLARDEAQADAALREAENRLKWQQEQRAALTQEMARGEALDAEMQAQLSALDAGLKESAQRIRECNRAVQALPMDALQQQVAHWRTQEAVAQQARRGAQARVEDARQAVQRLMERQQGLRTHQAGLESQRAALQLQQQTLREMESQVEAEIVALQAQTAPAEARRADLEAALNARQQAVDEAQKVLGAAEHRHAQARIRLNREEEALENLRQRIEDDFGLVDFQYDPEIAGPTPLPLDGMVEHLPVVTEITPDLEETLKRKRTQLRRMGAINPEADREYQEVRERHAFLTAQMADLEQAAADIRQVVNELDGLMKQAFGSTFEAVAAEFREIFRRLFGGGSARLILTDAEDLDKTGIDIEARLPGRRAQGLSLLSGGERSLTAVALVFALLKTSPTPFCILDEVDAMLDEANVVRLRDLLAELSAQTQFVVITHNRNTVQAADVIYGITMGSDSTSQMLSLRLDEVADLTR
ncbi:MAG: chromosome segregation protein SMC [Anaerolineales bacterium]